MFIVSKEIFDYRGGGLKLYNLSLIQKGREITKILNKIYPLIVAGCIDALTFSAYEKQF